ncbi:MAG: NTP transferase domain-containing protein [Clostridia bacterium]|nr:NTP transferase domain-containing protein [Clostridia bacterium]
MDVTLVIMAAGIGSRFGGGVKQLAPVGPHGEPIIDYSVHDAVKAGFNKIVFIIRHDIYDDFYEVIGKRAEERFKALGAKIEYAYQEPIRFPEGRKKPWGTGQAIMSCKGLVSGPFAVINADDYYGKDAFKKAYDFLVSMKGDSSFGMVGYVLKNTLSDNGGVTRGVCRLDGKGGLCGVEETKNIIKTPDGKASSDGREIPLSAIVSMNFWMFPASFIDVLEKGFPDFLASMTDPLKDEYLLPKVVDDMIKEKKCAVSVIPTDDSWFGVTYKEDKESVIEAFKKLYAAGEYENELYADLTEKK